MTYCPTTELWSWYKEAVEIQGGPTSRRGRWHLTFSRFNVTVQYLPGVLNGSADALSRWAYPGAGDDDLTIHGTAADAQAIADEEREMRHKGDFGTGLAVVTRSARNMGREKEQGAPGWSF